jgi:hypothetical protein
MSGLSSAIQIRDIIPRLEACKFSQRDIRAFLHDSDFSQQSWRNHQLCFLDA